MKTIIAGSRAICNGAEIYKELDNFEPWEITEVVCGMAAGPDSIGREWAKDHNIPVVEFPAKWKHYGRSAGIRRNIQMADYAEALIAFWDGESRGTKHMIEHAKSMDLKVSVIYLAPTITQSPVEVYKRKPTSPNKTGHKHHETLVR